MWKTLEPDRTSQIAASHLTTLMRFAEQLQSTEMASDRLASLCRVTISRFFRDRQLFQRLETEVLPRLATLDAAGRRGEIEVWSAGCGAGEERGDSQREPGCVMCVNSHDSPLKRVSNRDRRV